MISTLLMTLAAVVPAAETVTVEGKKVEAEATMGSLGTRSMLETPFSVQSYGASLIEDEQHVTANQVLRHDPGLTNVSTPGGFSAFNLSFRGFPSGADAVSFYGMGPGAMFSGSLGQLYSVERIEVFKGPSAGLGGLSPSASVGGSVNIVPKLPLPGKRRTAALGYRENGIVSAHVDVNHSLGESAALRLNLASEGGTTFYGGRDERDIAALALRQNLSENVEWILGYDQLRIRSEGYQNGFVLAADVPVPRAPDPARNHFQKWSWLQQEWNYAYSSLQWKLGEDWKLFIQGLYGIRRRPILSSGTGLIQNEEGDMLLRPNYLAKGTRYKPFFGGNVFLNGRLHTAGVEHNLTFSYLGNGFDFITAQGAPLSPIASHLDRPVYVEQPELSVVAQRRTSSVTAHTQTISDDMKLSDRLSVLVGVRNSTLNSEAFAVETGIREQNRHDTSTSPFGAVSYRFQERTHAYLSYAEGLERGGIAPASAANADQVMDPVRNRQIELGIKSEAWNGLTVNAALFEMERALEYLEPESNLYVQDGLQRNRGLEIHAVGRLSERLNLQGGLLWLDPRLVRSGEVQNKKAPGAPNINIPLTLAYQLAPAWNVSTSVYHFGRQYVDTSNSRSLDPWTRVDAGLKWSLRWAERPLLVQALVENLGNQRYWASAAGGQLALGSPQIWKVALRTEL